MSAPGAKERPFQRCTWLIILFYCHRPRSGRPGDEPALLRPRPTPRLTTAKSVRLDARAGQRRHTPQRSLLVGQLREAPRGTRRSRSPWRRSSVNPLQPLFRVGVELSMLELTQIAPPRMAVDDDRADRLRQVAVVPEEIGGFSADRGQVVLDDTGRAPGSEARGSGPKGIELKAGPEGNRFDTPRDTDDEELRPGSRRRRRQCERGRIKAEHASTSTLTAAKISAGAVSCATSVATRRSAACSSASRGNDTLDFVSVTSRFESEITSSVSAA